MNIQLIFQFLIKTLCQKMILLLKLLFQLLMPKIKVSQLNGLIFLTKEKVQVKYLLNVNSQLFNNKPFKIITQMLSRILIQIRLSEWLCLVK
jgi:hypothetical protein